MALRDSWKDAGVGFGHAFRDLGKAFAKTAKTTIKKVDEWANKEDEENAQPAANEGKAETAEAEENKE